MSTKEHPPIHDSTVIILPETGLDLNKEGFLGYKTLHGAKAGLGTRLCDL